MATRELLLLNRSDCRALVERLAAALNQWREEWCTDETAPGVVTLCRTGGRPAFTNWRWRSAVLPDGSFVSAGLSLASSEALTFCLVGKGACRGAARAARVQIESELLQAAIEDLVVLLLKESRPTGTSAAVEWDTSSPSERTFQQRWGFVAARCIVGASKLVLVLHPNVTHGFLVTTSRAAKRRSGASSPIRSVLASRLVAAEVLVGSGELLLRELATLSVGDVITLDHRLQDPVTLRLAGGGDLCTGYLGVCQGRKAVQLTKFNDKQEV